MNLKFSFFVDVLQNAMRTKDGSNPTQVDIINRLFDVFVSTHRLKDLNGNPLYYKKDRASRIFNGQAIVPIRIQNAAKDSRLEDVISFFQQNILADISEDDLRILTDRLDNAIRHDKTITDVIKERMYKKDRSPAEFLSRIFLYTIIDKNNNENSVDQTRKKPTASDAHKKTPLITAVKVLCSSHIPASHRNVEVTRYCLYALCCHFYPEIKEYSSSFGITEENKKHQETPNSVHITTNNFRHTSFQIEELCFLQKHLTFCLPINKNSNQSATNNQSKTLLVKLDNNLNYQDIDQQLSIDVLDTLLKIYREYPETFHSDSNGKWKWELNITLSDYILYLAYKGHFATHWGQIRLLEIANMFIKTNNLHSSYMYSFFESQDIVGSDGALVSEPLVTTFDEQSHFTQQVITLVGDFFQAIFSTTNANTPFARKFIGWINGNSHILFNLIENYNCYDPAIWSTYRGQAKTHDREDVLRDIVRCRLLDKSFNLRDKTFIHHALGFFQLVSKLSKFKLNKSGLDANWLLIVPNELGYTKKLMVFMSNTVLHMQEIPEKHRKMVNQALHAYAISLDKNEKKEFLNICKDINWNQTFFSSHFLNVLLDQKPLPSPPNIHIVEDSIKSCKEKLLNHSIDALEALQLIGSIASFHTKNLSPEILQDYDWCLNKVLLELPYDINNERVYSVVLHARKHWPILQPETKHALISFAEKFLNGNLYRTAKANVIIHALIILGNDCDHDHNDRFEYLFGYFSAQNNSKNNNYLRILICLFRLWTKTEKRCGFLTEKLCTDTLYANTLATLCAPEASTILWPALKQDEKFYLFFCNLLKPDYFWELLIDAQVGLTHYAKKDPQLNEQFLSLLKVAISNWDAISTDKMRYALVCHIMFFYTDEDIPKYILEYTDWLLHQAYLNLKDIAKKCGASRYTFLFHLVRLYRNQPEKTALLCARAQAKLLGQLCNHSNSQKELLKDRFNFFSIAISNPSIYPLSQYYCKRIRSVLLDDPSYDNKSFYDLLNNGITGTFPNWFVTIDTIQGLELKEKSISALSKDILFQTQPSDDKLREIAAKEGPWENRYDEKSNEYKPKCDIVVIRNKDGMLDIIDGEKILYWLQTRAKRSNDFNVRILELFSCQTP